MRTARHVALAALSIGAVLAAPAGAATQDPARVSTAGLAALSCPTSTQCTGVDANRQAGTTDLAADARVSTFNPLGPTNGSLVRTAPGVRLTSIDCASAQRCVAIGPEFNGATIIDPAGTGPLAPTPFAAPARGATSGVACPDAEQCTVVTVDGYAYTFDPNAPGTPTGAQVHPGDIPLARLSCPSTTVCVAVDSDGGAVTFDPLAPRTQTTIPVVSAGKDVRELACPTVDLCVAIARPTGSQVAFKVRFVPTTRKIIAEAKVAELVQALRCPSDEVCTMGAGSGGVVAFRTVGTDVPRAVDPQVAPDAALACRSATQCTIADRTGMAATYDPTATAFATAPLTVAALKKDVAIPATIRLSRLSAIPVGRVTCGPTCGTVTVSGTVSGRSVGRRSVTVDDGRTRSLSFVLSRQARATLRARGRLRVTISVTARRTPRTTVTAKRVVTVRPR